MRSLPGAARDAVAGDDDEAGLVAGVVGDVVGDHVEAVALGGDPRGDGGETGLRPAPSPSPSATNLAALAVDWAVRTSTPRSCSRRKRWHCAVATGIDSDDLDLVERQPGGADEAVLDVEHDLARDQQVVVERQGVLGEVDDALDRVLDRHDAAVDVTGLRRRRARRAR